MQNVIAWLKSAGQKVYSMAGPLASGVLIGYFGHPFINIAFKALGTFLKLV